jgi:outer membrane protein assembly factor BamB
MNVVDRLLMASLLIITPLLFAGCSSTPELPKPQAFGAYTPQLAGKIVWQQSIGRVGFPLSVAVHDNQAIVANDSGLVSALQVDSGKLLWRLDVGAPISAGVGSDGRFSAVVSNQNQLIVLALGKIVWRQRLASPVMTAPLVAGERVFVVGTDRNVQAFDALDGHKIWDYQKPNDALILTQPTVLAAFQDTLLVGFGTQLLGLDPTLGTLRFEPNLATPRGTNEIERLADVVGPLGRTGNVVCARAFQAAVACINAKEGSVLWSRPASGLNAIAVDEKTVFGSDSYSRTSAWHTADGSLAWTTQHWLYRELGNPMTDPSTQSFVVGDGQGFVNWISRETGDPKLRLATDGSPIRVAPVKVQALTLVVTSAGGVFAFDTK